MTTDVSGQTHQYFLQEAAELLQTIDDELQTLRSDFSVQKVHNLMRAAHTLKGAAASVGLEAVKKTTHSLEDVFRALCYPDTTLSVAVEGLIFEGYDCLQLLLSAQLSGAEVEETDILDRMAAVVTQLQEKLGDRFGQGGHLPTSSELGFDMTKSIFEVGVSQRLDALSKQIENGDAEALADLLQSQAEVFIGLAESLDLPGFGAIAQATLTALAQSPDQVLAIAPVALANYTEAKAAVLAGDREQGGAPSAALQQFCTDIHSQAVLPIESPESPLARQKARPAVKTSRHASPLVTAPQSSWLQQFWNALTHPISGGQSFTKTHPQVKRGKVSADASEAASTDQGAATGLNLSASALENSVNHTADSDAPAELDLTDLIPPDLASVNLLPGLSLPDDPFHPSLANSELSIADAPDSAELTLANDPASADLDSLPGLSALLSLGDSGSTDLTTYVEAEDSTSQYAQLAKDLSEKISSAPAQGSTATIRISVEHLDQLSQTMGELLTQQNRQALYNEQLTTLVKKLLGRIARQQQLGQDMVQSKVSSYSSAESPAPMAALNPVTNSSQPHFDSLELDQYSDIQLLAQAFLEETVQQSENVEAIDLFVRRAQQELEKQQRLLANTRETLLAARMLPLEQVFKRFLPALERLKAQHRKQVTLVLEGGDVLVDKAIADRLFDPLLHLVRNAFDHGIESPEKRQQQSKPISGEITLAAKQQGRHLVVSVQDDGQGLDLEMIRSKAIESQLITAAEAASLTSDQTIDLLFEPGFSTASEVDDLSGRGVGLDAVRAQVRSLQGWVTVSYEPGAGTCFTLQIPSNLTIAKLLLCQAQERVYALITDAIEHISIPAPAQIRAWEGGKTLTWQTDNDEHIVPVSALTDVLHYASPLPNHRLSEPRSSIEITAAAPVILLRHQNSLVGLEVDQLLGEQELVINALGETIVPPPYLYGSSILPDGQLTLVLDGLMLAKIVLDQRTQSTQRNIDSSTAGEDSGPARSVDRETGTAKKLILTVDDSITVRNALAEALQKADYQVIQARDGAEALQQLQRYPNVKMILCDIEMPGMNGFEFLKLRQQTPQIAAIPTIMLTSRAGTKHRLLTQELGATTYLTKPYLTPQLLEAVAEAIDPEIRRPINITGDTHE